MWWPTDSDVVATTSLSGGHHILTQEEQRMPHTSLSGGHHILWPPDNMWWPPDSDVVATTSLSGGHHILSGGYQIKIFSAVVPAGLRSFVSFYSIVVFW